MLNQNIALIINLLNLLNAATPGIASLIFAIRNPDNTVSFLVTLDAADAQFAANLVAAQDWINTHPPVKP